MKSLASIFFGIFAITSVVIHLWTVIIAFKESGIIACIITLCLPAIGEIYWMFKMFGNNNLYAFLCLAHLISAIPLAFIASSE